MPSDAIAHVVSLLIKDSDQPDRVLLGVRCPETNIRHPNVLSTITQRIPESLEMQIHGVSDLLFTTDWGNEQFVAPPRRDTELFGDSLQVKGVLTFVVEAIISRKLDLGRSLERGKVGGRVSIAGIARARVEDSTGTGLEEPTVMTTLLVNLDHGANEIPRETASYSTIAWVSAKDLVVASRHNDALRVLPSVDAFAVCLRGLCVRGAVRVLEGSAGEQD